MTDIPRFSKHNLNSALSYFEDNGCIIFNDLIDPKLVQEIQNTLKQILRKQIENNSVKKEFKKGNGFDYGLLEYFESNDDLRERFYKVIQGISSLYKYVGNADLLSVITKFGIAEPIVYIPPQIRIDLPSDERFLQPVHQEIRDTRSQKMIFAITALCNIDKEKGALKVGLGSHKLGPIIPTIKKNMKYQYISPEIYEKKYPLIQAPLMEGETLILNKHTLHASAPNTSEEIRWQMVSRYEDALDMPYLDGDDTLEKVFNVQKNSRLIQK